MRGSASLRHFTRQIRRAEFRKHFVTPPRLDLTADTDLARVCATDYARPIGAPQNVATIKKVRQRQERQDSAGLQKSLFLDRHPDNSVNPVWYQ